jgi:hypothetical protein
MMHAFAEAFHAFAEAFQAGATTYFLIAAGFIIFFYAKDHRGL